MYRNNELIIICKFCGKKQKKRAKREIHPNRNFCSRECYQQWLQEHRLSPEIKRRRWNSYMLDRYRKSEQYQAIQIRQGAKQRHKNNMSILKTEYE